jgi:AraC family transcriptional regulator
MGLIDYHRHTLKLEALPADERAHQLRQFERRIRVFHYSTDHERLAPHGGGLSIKLVLRGRERFHLGDRPVELTTGDALLMPAHAHYGSEIGTPTESFSVFFPTHFCRQLLNDALAAPLHSPRDFGVDRLPPVPVPADAAMQARLQSARWALQAHDTARAEELLQEAALRLVAQERELQQATSNLAAQRPAVRHELLRRLQRVRSFLQADLAQEVTLAQLAEVAQLSRFHLLRVFRDAFGCTPAQYHAQLRLEAARARLQASAEPVAAVARSLGYRSPSAFTRAWRRRFGTLPSQGRR